METLQVGPHSTLRQLQVCRMFLLLLPLLLISATSLATACSGDQDCPAELYCYKMICSTPDQIAELAFSAGKPCSDQVDCPEACQTGLSSPVCGPYLRSSRLPEPQHPAHCSADSDCDQHQVCVATLRGLECRTWQQVLQEIFHLGEKCSDESDCPEACYTSYDEPTCGPYL